MSAGAGLMVLGLGGRGNGAPECDVFKFELRRTTKLAGNKRLSDGLIYSIRSSVSQLEFAFLRS
jgi:hypothetical protein